MVSAGSYNREIHVKCASCNHLTKTMRLRHLILKRLQIGVHLDYHEHSVRFLRYDESLTGSLKDLIRHLIRLTHLSNDSVAKLKVFNRTHPITS